MVCPYFQERNVPRWQDRNFPFGRGLLGVHAILRLPVKRRRCVKTALDLDRQPGRGDHQVGDRGGHPSRLIIARYGQPDATTHRGAAAVGGVLAGGSMFRWQGGGVDAAFIVPRRCR